MKKSTVENTYPKSTASETTIRSLREKASLLETERRKAYNDRVSEIVVEMATWGLPPEEYPMQLARRVFQLGFECGVNKMYEYL